MFSVKSLYASYRARHKEKKNIIESPTGFRAYVKRHKIHTDSVNGSARMIVSILAHIFFLLLCFHLSRPLRKSIEERGTKKKSWVPDRNLKSMTSLSNTRWLLYLLRYREPHSSKAKRVYYVYMWKLSHTGWAMFIKIKRTVRWSPNKQTNKKMVNLSCEQ